MADVPAETAAASLLPGRARWIVYVTAAAVAAGWGVVEANANPHWGWAAAYAAGSTAAHLLAASNTTKA